MPCKIAFYLSLVFTLSLASPAIQPALAANPKCSKIYAINIDTILDGLNPFAIYTNKILGMSHLQLAPPSFFTYEGIGSIVGINAVSTMEMYRDAADYMTGSAQTVPGKVFQSRVVSLEDFIGTLSRIYRESGPINKLVIAAHGETGSMNFGTGPLNLAWVTANKGSLDNLPRDLFTPNAKIVLISCSTANGFFFDRNYGPMRLKAIFSPLLKQGGQIIASTRYVNPRLSKIPAEYKFFGERFLRHIIFSPLVAAIDTATWLLYDWRSKFKKKVVIEIEPQPAVGSDKS